MRLFNILLILFSLCGNCLAGIDLNGDADYVVVTDSASLDISGASMSFSVWINPDFDQTAVSSTILDKTIGNNDSYRILFIDAEDDWRVRIITASGAVNCDTTGVTWTIGTWHNLAGRYDGTNIYVYWDGVLENTCSQTGNIVQSGDNMRIGNLTTGGNLYDGKMSNLFINSADIGADNISLLYSSKLKRIPLQINSSTNVLFLQLDDFSDATALNTDADGYKDLSGNSNHGQGVDADSDSLNVAETILTY